MIFKRWGMWVPLIVTLITLGLVPMLPLRESVGQGIMVGILVAYVQSLASVGAMKWAWKKSFFYWVWGGGVLFRFVVFGGVAYVVYAHTHLSLVASLLTLVTATTLFMVFESSAAFKRIT
jgi:hypothetical protein